jgi:hypothetical protein
MFHTGFHMMGDYEITFRKRIAYRPDYFLAEACGSRTQTFNSQLTANDDVAASAKFQLESIGVSPCGR